MSILSPRWLRRAAPLVAALALLVPMVAQAQPDADVKRLDRRLKSLVNSFDGIRWSNVNIYRVGDEYRNRLLKYMAEADEPMKRDLCARVQVWLDEEMPCPQIFDIINAAVRQRDPNRFFPQFKQIVAQRLQTEPDFIDDQELRDVANIATSIRSAQESRPANFYLVTSRNTARPRLIAMLGVTGDEMTGNLRVAGDKYVWAGTDLYEQLRLNSQDTGMYQELRQGVADNMTDVVANRTFAIKNLDSIQLAPLSRARAVYLDEGNYGYAITGISEGRPIRGEAKADSAGEGDGFSNIFNQFETQSGGLLAQAEVPGTGEYRYELGVGTDPIVSFREYNIVNKKVPELLWGLEVENNFDEINYPSIWGGRLQANLILENIKLGAVIPQLFQFGGDSISTSGLGESQQKLIGGYGAAISGDFAFPVLQNSGLFNFYASYTFSEQTDERIAETRFVQEGNNLFPVPNSGETGYLVRYAVQGHYSFGFYADRFAQHLFRVKLGGTVYGVDHFIRRVDPTFALADSVEDKPMILEKVFGENIGGVSGRIEYMRTGVKYPFGAFVQYFDQALLSDVWVQFIINQQIDLKFDVKYFTPVLRDPHPWENNFLLVPSVGLRYHFGMPKVAADPFGFGQ